MLKSRDLKSHVDLRDVVRQHWGAPQRQTRRYDVHFSKWRQDGRQASFTVYSDSFKDYGGDGASGDIFDFIQREHNLDFRESLQWLAAYCGISGEISASKQASLVLNSYPEKTGAPPPQAWQDAAQALLAEAQARLWDGSHDSNTILQYLRRVRGLTTERIKAAGYGYNPRWTRSAWINPDTGKAAQLAPGIIEPWFYDGHLWALRVRCRVGNLAQFIGQADDTLRGDTSPKYLNLAGSVQSGALYNGDAIYDGCRVLLVEGGFDAVLANQVLPDDVIAVTLGSATTRPTEAQRALFSRAREIILLLDNDTAGQDAQAYLQRALSGRVKIARLPQGKDVTAFITAHDGDLCAVVDAAIGAAWWPAGVPDAVRSTLLTYFRPSTAPVVEMLNAAASAGLLDAACFTMDELLTANEVLGYGLAEKTIRRIIDELESYFLSKLETVKDLSFVSNSGKKGRRAHHYALKSVEDVRQALIAWAVPRIYEKYHDTTGESATVAIPTAGMIAAIGFPQDEAERLAQALNMAYQPAYDAQDNQQDWMSKRALQVLNRLTQRLNDTASTPFPRHWPLDSATHYRAAFLRATNDAGQRRSRREMCELLGIANGSLKKMLHLAGLEKEQERGEYEIAEIKHADALEQQVQRLSRTLKGYPMTILAHDVQADTVSESVYHGADSQAYVARQLAEGKQIALKFQVANHYIEATSAPPQTSVPPAESARETASTPTRPPQPRPTPPRKRPRWYGPTYSPYWVRDQLLLALLRMGRLRDVGYGRYVDVLTGEAFDEPTARQLLQVLLPHEAISYPALDDPLLLEMLSLGGVLDSS